MIMNIIVMIFPTSVRMTPCPLRLQLQTLWTGGILMGNMTIWRVNYLAKVAHTNVTVVLNIPTSVMMTQEDSLSS